ncbi:MAG: DUF6876 family protein [Gillisia sp.]
MEPSSLPNTTFTNMKGQVNEVWKSLQEFNGSDKFYLIPRVKTRFTTGIKFLAEKAECFWLITDASIISKGLMDKSYFITINFKRLPKEEQKTKGFEAYVVYGDGNGNDLFFQKYRVTDFPFDEFRLFFIEGTLMLPNEY